MIPLPRSTWNSKKPKSSKAQGLSGRLGGLQPVTKRGPSGAALFAWLGQLVWMKWVTGPVTSLRRPLKQGRTGQTPWFSGDAADLKILGANYSTKGRSGHEWTRTAPVPWFSYLMFAKPGICLRIILLNELVPGRIRPGFRFRSG